MDWVGLAQPGPPLDPPLQTVSDFHTRIAIPYIDKLLENIKHRFSDDALSCDCHVDIQPCPHSNC